MDGPTSARRSASTWATPAAAGKAIRWSSRPRNLTDQTSIGLNGNGLRHSADMKIVERFTRKAADELQYEIHIEDPKTYTRPFTIRVPLISPPGIPAAALRLP